MTLQLNCYDTSNIIYETRELAEDEDDQEKNKRMECGWKRIRQKMVLLELQHTSNS